MFRLAAPHYGLGRGAAARDHPVDQRAAPLGRYARQGYRFRWQIELFFKDLKQNLKIKTFVGTSENAVKTQVWTALIAMLLLKFLQLKSSWKWSLSNLVALLRFNLLTYRDLWAWLDNPFGVPIQEPAAEQLALPI